jgi:methylase of polypeptide subunit release factors
MPRIPHSLLLRAYKISPLLPLVLRATRTLASAVAELRWLVEHLQEDDKTRSLTPALQKQKVLQLCKRRQRGEPLQYILGTQPFGELTIKCRPGVLIPR